LGFEKIVIFSKAREKLGKTCQSRPGRGIKSSIRFFFIIVFFLCVEQQGEWVLFDHAYTKDCDPSIRGEWVLFFP
jgi:hypothetical protein